MSEERDSAEDREDRDSPVARIMLDIYEQIEREKPPRRRLLEFIRRFFW